VPWSDSGARTGPPELGLIASQRADLRPDQRFDLGYTDKKSSYTFQVTASNGAGSVTSATRTGDDRPAFGDKMT
jgi:hypothetical protein